MPPPGVSARLHVSTTTTTRRGSLPTRGGTLVLTFRECGKLGDYSRLQNVVATHGDVYRILALLIRTAMHPL